MAVTVKVDEDELIEHWTLVGDELGQVAGKRGATRLGFALLLKFFSRMGRFPRGRGELPDEAVAYVARQVGVRPLSGERAAYVPHTWRIRQRPGGPALCAHGILRPACCQG